MTAHTHHMASAPFYLSDFSLTALALPVPNTIVEETCHSYNKHSTPIFPPTPVGPSPGDP